ncbi:MAG: ribosome silencing factor [Candidatus Omnitrophica bacterium]|nr:ribosome silencing factor [Candidatus Omnitrophota bacterium]
MTLLPEGLARLAAQAAIAKLAEDVVVMDLRSLSSVSDFFVLATAASRRQLRAIVEDIDGALRREGRRVRHVEGLDAAAAGRAAHEPSAFAWVLMDCGSLVVHLFTPPAREFYQLERLWGDAPQVPLDPLPARQ